MTSPNSPSSPSSSSGTPSYGAHEEPEITQETDVPVDGRDVEGEKLMKEVGNKKLEQQPGEERAK
jgi:hypothetical protein